MAVLRMTIGIQGSGKSTWARSFVHANPDVVYVNPDTIWTSIGDITDRSLGGTVYMIAMKKTREALSQGKDVLVDATFVKRKWRKGFLNIADDHKAKKIAHWFNVNLDTATKRVKSRASDGGMNVPEKDIKMYSEFLKNTPPDNTEFDQIVRM
jgi:predicted kinase